MPGNRFTLEVQPTIPQSIERLSDLANNLIYSWDRQVRSLFRRIDPELWERQGHNPKVFLRQVAQQRLDEAALDRVFMQDYHRVISSFDAYLAEKTVTDVSRLFGEGDLIAYFCAEFGFHESFPIYSGGLGILAGDHCKAASDLGLPFVAVGLLYRQGYFTQTIDGHGNQIAHYRPHNFDDLPIEAILDTDGNEMHVQVELPGRKVELKIWCATIGHVTLYLLDSDLPVNSEHDRSITYQLYGGDIHTRMQQEIVLGIGGVRALRALGLEPSVWHINEGHPAFQLLERVREYVATGDDFDSALERVASCSVFTTHTPVPAGHDIFHHDLMRQYLGSFIPQLKVDEGRFFALGASPTHPQGFNQTALALRCTRFHNGVSRIHGGVASHMEGYIWPQVPVEENPMGYVTNGVHAPTFLSREWINQLDLHFGGGWRNELRNPGFWRRVDDLPDHSFWSVRQTMKSGMFEDIRQRAVLMHRRNGTSEAQVARLIKHLCPTETDILTVGFARRFATYKRATLIFSDLTRLARLVNDPKRPVLFLFAGKAHPSDQPGQELIRRIHQISRLPEFEGKVVLLENYDLALGRRLVTAVDVWLNNPEYPLEASGTSGQKAGINGVINLSVTDGWWGEGYDGDNGWAITPHGPQYDAEFRNREEANELLDLLEYHVIPLYYERDGHGYSPRWVAKSKASMRTIMPRFNALRMVSDYGHHFYSRANEHGRNLARGSGRPAGELATWKRRILAAWDGVTIRRTNEAIRSIKAGQTLPIEVAVRLNGLAPEDVVVECLLGTENVSGEFELQETYSLIPGLSPQGDETPFSLHLPSTIPGLQFYKLRIYPWHPLLAHRFELGRMLWV